MSANPSNKESSIQVNSVLLYPKGGKPSIITNEWQVWNGTESEVSLNQISQDQKVLAPFQWWLSHGQVQAQDPDSEVAKRIQNKTIGVWFAADEDILKHHEVIEAGKLIWPIVGADFPIFRDGRSFSTAALLRERFNWSGEICAIGDVLIDQLILGARSGFDSFALRADQNLDTALKQFDLFTVTTQNSWRGKRSLLATN
ncbi:hypothetical protein DP176_08305 [Polynucleobacter paneuropaeus]|uniref:DUF934 domain-containing protein n=1 Tax=Polynucleobacter paneuropaeus TaxID=2527775 RepID=A0ABX9F8C3_9BURK|nr:DUF934 domain-containing protein [Polynucleobacter paneuropaeus]MBT8529326.1 DUF934 domain-containing protein [Polynucleobacter paneuropaeus]QWD18364.1 DUF934 domain-containing protein [Polynucleobacter paneuropaeus]RAZ41116.1 hypothetical protein DP176_08305 [Polynucleobacter paneuropaeus]